MEGYFAPPGLVLAEQERAQGASGTKPVYRTVETAGPSHQRVFTVEVDVEGVTARGTGPSKRAAEDAAAASALELLDAKAGR